MGAPAPMGLPRLHPGLLDLQPASAGLPLGRRMALASGGTTRLFHQPSNRNEVLNTFNESIALVRDLLPRFDEAAMNDTWRLYAGDKEVLAQPRALFLRDVMFSHCYQHRGQLSVYLRMLNIPVPASWGPSADEPPLFMQSA